MKLFIERGTLVEDVKKVFTNYYPCLKIELYKIAIDRQQSNIKNEILLPKFNVGKLLKFSNKLEIDLSKNVTVEQLETELAKIGLGAEVFRSSGDVWVETSLTNNWTLQQQNDEAEELNCHFKQKRIIT